MKKGDIVMVNLGHKVITGEIVCEVDENSEYISVKHDNFKSEVFNKDKATNISEIAVKKHMSELGKKGGKALWLGKSKEEKSRIMSERRIKGLKRSAFKESKDAECLEIEGYKGGDIIK